MDSEENNNYDMQGSSTGGMAHEEDAEVQVVEVNNEDEGEDSLAQETKLSLGLSGKKITDSIYLMDKSSNKKKGQRDSTGQLLPKEDDPGVEGTQQSTDTKDQLSQLNE